VAFPASNSPGYWEFVDLAVDRFMCEVHTCAPGTVVSYDAAKQTATIQPSFQRVYDGQAPMTYPKIYNVPVIFPRTANAWIRVPVAAGDNVMLHFSERSLDKWLTQGGGIMDPGMPHKFQETDAIATPGLYPQSGAFTPKGADTSIEVTNGLGWLEVTQDGKFKLSNGSGDLLTTIQAISTDLKALVLDLAAFTAPPGGGPLIPNVTYPTDLIQLTTDLAKLTGFLP